MALIFTLLALFGRANAAPRCGAGVGTAAPVTGPRCRTGGVVYMAGSAPALALLRASNDPAVVLGPGGELVPTNNGDNGGMTEARLINTLEQPTFITADASRSRLDLAEEAQSLSGALDAADTIEARDSLERMLAHQLATAHVSAMKMSADLNRRLDYLANVRGEESERVNIQATRLANAVGRLMSTYQQGLLTVQRLRSGGKQTVVVQHVHVNEGGQAVVAGKVGRGARGRGTAGGKVRK